MGGLSTSGKFEIEPQDATSNAFTLSVVYEPRRRISPNSGCPGSRAQGRIPWGSGAPQALLHRRPRAPVSRARRYRADLAQLNSALERRPVPSREGR